MPRMYFVITALYAVRQRCRSLFISWGSGSTATGSTGAPSVQLHHRRCIMAKTTSFTHTAGTASANGNAAVSSADTAQAAQTAETARAQQPARPAETARAQQPARPAETARAAQTAQSAGSAAAPPDLRSVFPQYKSIVEIQREIASDLEMAATFKSWPDARQREFLDFPLDLYKGNPFFVPPLPFRLLKVPPFPFLPLPFPLRPPPEPPPFS